MCTRFSAGVIHFCYDVHYRSNLYGDLFCLQLPGKKDRLINSLSSDEDMIDITHQGTVNEIHDQQDEDAPPASTSEILIIRHQELFRE